MTPSEETENAAEKEGKRLERQRANEERKKERRALAERNNNLLDQMNAFANGSEIDEDPFTSDVVRECGQLNTSSSEFEEADNIPLRPNSSNTTEQRYYQAARKNHY